MPRDDPGQAPATQAPFPLIDARENPLALLHLTEAEQGLLGAILVNNEAYDRVAELVRPGDFASAVHGRIYEEIGKEIDRGQPADAALLTSRFKEDEALAKVGGARYLATLAASAVSVVNAPHYARTIADLARRRDIILACQDAIAEAAVVDIDRPAAVILEEFDRRLIELGGGSGEGEPIPLAAALDEAIMAAERVYKADGKITGVTTGLADLDRKLGGLHPSNLVVLAGRPGMGKTALATSVAEAAARSGKQVLFFALEMSARELAGRLIAGESGVSAEQQTAGPLSGVDITRIIESRARLAGLPLTIDDTPAAAVAQLRARSRRHMRRHGLDLIVVDYLQLLLGEKVRAENRVQEVSAITRGLKMLAKELRVPVLALSQLSRAVEQREDKRPVLSDLRESGSIEQDADTVIFLYRHEVYLARDEPKRRARQTDDSFNAEYDRWREELEQVRSLAELIVDKNRHGSTCTVKARFDAERTRFETLFWGDRR